MKRVLSVEHACKPPRYLRIKRHLGERWACRCGKSYALRGRYDSLGDYAGARWERYHEGLFHGYGSYGGY